MSGQERYESLNIHALPPSEIPGREARVALRLQLRDDDEAGRRRGAQEGGQDADPRLPHDHGREVRGEHLEPAQGGHPRDSEEEQLRAQL